MTDRTISPLRQRMTEDMTIRGFTVGTQRGYLVAVENFTSIFLFQIPAGCSQAVFPRPRRERLDRGVKRTFLTECPKLGPFQTCRRPIQKVRD